MKIAGFISYSHADGSDLTKELVKYLTNLFPNFQPVFDEDVFEGDKIEKIEEKLRLCNILIVIITPASLSSRAITKEIEIAKKMNMKIIPCKDTYIEKDWNKLPWGIQNYKGIKFESGDELKRKIYSALQKNLSDLSRDLQDSIAKTQTEKSLPTTEEVKELSPLKRDIPWFKFRLKPHRHEHAILASITKGQITNILLDRKALSLIIEIDEKDEGLLKVIFERKLLDAKKNGKDEEFFVLVDGEEIKYQDISSPLAHVILIPFSKESKEIEIIGTQMEGISYEGVAKDENIVSIVKGSSTPHNKEFLKPKLLKIKQGETVRWSNDDIAAHAIISGTPDIGPDDLFDSSLFLPNVTFEVTFNQKGKYPYFDLVDPWIKGMIIVN